MSNIYKAEIKDGSLKSLIKQIEKECDGEYGFKNYSIFGQLAINQDEGLSVRFQVFNKADSVKIMGIISEANR